MSRWKKLERDHQFKIYLPGSKVVRDCILSAVKITDPEVGNGITYIKKVKYFQTDPHGLEIP